MENYGWSSRFPQESLIVGSSSGSMPSAAHKANMSLLSNFLAKLPFKVNVTSGYRSPAGNVAAGGENSSQHMNGLAVDFNAYMPGTGVLIPNQVVAAWFWVNKHWFPEIDQVIWYTNTNHVHVGICRDGATGCVNKAPRGQFLRATKESSDTSYSPWAPSGIELIGEELADLMPLRPNNILIPLAVSAGISIIALAFGWKFRHRIRSKLGIN